MLPSLQALDLHLHNLDGALPISAVRGHALNGLFHAELGKHDAALADRLHHCDGPAPFSLAPLFRGEAFLGVRVATLTEELGQRVAEVWAGLMAQRVEVRLGSAQMVVRAIQPGHPRATTYEQLLAEAPPVYRVRLRFETPLLEERETSRRSKHRGVLLPAPGVVWRDYLRCWEAYAGAGAKLPPGLIQWIERRVLVTEAALNTYLAHGENTVEWKGLMGEVEYHAFPDHSEEDGVPPSRVPDYLRAWQALAYLAEFCGTGEKTTMGMGRTSKLKLQTAKCKLQNSNS